MILSAQMGKAGPPMEGHDLHIGDFAWGVLPAAAPLAVGIAVDGRHGDGVSRSRSSERVAVSFIGEGGSSLGEWHEAINLCAARELPVIFCLENNQTALSTPVRDNSAARVFADKAAGYGIPGLTIDGTDPDASRGGVHVGGRARARGRGAGAHRGRRDAHVRSRASRRHAVSRQGSAAVVGLPPLHDAATRIRSCTSSGARAIRFRRMRERLEDDGVIDAHAPRRGEGAGRGDGRSARAARDRERRGRSPSTAGVGVFKDDAPRARVEMLDPRAGWRSRLDGICRRSKPGRRSTRRATTFLEAVMLGVGDALDADPRVVRLRRGRRRRSTATRSCCCARCSRNTAIASCNSPLAEGAVLGVCIGAALAGLRPIGEMQFNDFVATGFNQLVNNAAKIRYRWGGERADGRAHAVGRPAPRRAVSLPEHRAVVLSHARPQDRRPVDAARCARADGGGGRRSRSGAVLRAHRALSRSAHQAESIGGRARARCRREGRAAARRRRPRDHFLRRVRARLHARRREAGRRRHRGERARSALARRRSTATRVLAVARAPAAC